MIRDITAFHRRAFIPSRTTVIARRRSEPRAAGRRGAARVRRLDAGGDRADCRSRRVGSPAAPPTRLAVVHARSAQSELRIGHVALPRRTPDYHGALVANMVLGGQFVSRINMNLPRGQGLHLRGRTAFEFRRAPGPFVLHASVQHDATADALKEALGEIRAIRGERPVTREELELGTRLAHARVSAQLRDGRPGRPRRRAARALRSARRLLHDLRPQGAVAHGTDVTAIAAKHIDPARLLTVVVGDRDKLTPS
jgi:zinc protease